MNFSKVHKVNTPVRGTPKSAGMDLFIPDFTDIYIRAINIENRRHRDQAMVEEQRKVIMVRPHGQVRIPLGIRVEIPEGYMLLACNRGSTSWMPTMDVLAKVIDQDFQGEVFLTMHNYSDFLMELTPGQKIVQVVCVPVLIEGWDEKPDEELHRASTERGTGAMGHTDA